MNTSVLHYSHLEPKGTFYHSNGTGRDSYILHNSGGMVKAVKLVARPSSAFDRPPSRPSSVPKGRPRIDGKAIHYYSDGTGRDKYIVYNAGGFERGSNAHPSTFIDSLRVYPRMRTGSYVSKDYFNWAQNWKREKEQVIEKSRGTVVKDMLKRLTSPKIVTFKTPELRKLNQTNDYTYMGHKLDRSFF